MLQALFGDDSESQDRAWAGLSAFVEGKKDAGRGEWLGLADFLARLQEWQAGKTLDEILLVFNADEIKLAEWLHSQPASADWPTDNHAGETAALTGPSVPLAQDMALVFDLDNIRAADLFTLGSDRSLFDRLAGHSPKPAQGVTKVYDLNQVSFIETFAS